MLRASSMGSGGSTRISSVCQSSSTASSSRLVRRRPSGSSSRAATRRSLSIVDRRATSVGWAVNTGRTAMCRSPSSTSSALDAGLLDAREGLLEPAALGLAAPQQRPAPVDLLGDVGEVEVGGERPDQPDGRLQVELGQILEAVALRVGPHLLDEIEELLALGADQRLAEDRRDQPDVLAQGGVRRTERVRCSRHVHPCVPLATPSPPASAVGEQGTQQPVSPKLLPGPSSSADRAAAS